MNKHTIRMLIGCVLPLLLIFLLPAFGVSSGVTIFIFVLLMFLCHLLMPMHHGGHHQDDKHSHDGTR